MDPMRLTVDFNRVDKLGRVPALIPAGHEAELGVGALVIADDGEGTQCQATVEDIGPGGRHVLLVPVPGTFKRQFRAARPA